MHTTITDQDIRALQQEAAQAGDRDMVSICRLACGDEETATQEQIKTARETCERVIHETRTREETEDAYGLTFEQWLKKAGRRDSASQHDLRAAWRAGEDPSDYKF